MFNSGSNLDPGAGMVTSRSGLGKGNPLLTEKFTTVDKASLLGAFHSATRFGTDNKYPYESPNNAIDTVGDIVPGDLLFARPIESNLLDGNDSLYLKSVTPSMNIMSLRAWNNHFDEIADPEYKTEPSQIEFAAKLNFAGVAKTLRPGDQLVQSTIGRVHDGVFNIWSDVKHQSRLWVVLGHVTTSAKLQFRTIVRSDDDYPASADFKDFDPIRKYRIGVVTSCDSVARLTKFDNVSEFPFFSTKNYNVDLQRLSQLHRLTVYVNGKLFQ